ncbi:MAG: hypothetical protein ACPLYF_05830, partial [Fervidobacterium sp.]
RELEEGIASLKSVLSSDDIEKIKSLTDTLIEKSRKITEKMYMQLSAEQQTQAEQQNTESEKTEGSKKEN